MALNVRKTSEDIADALVAAFNKLKADVISTKVHRDVTSQPSAGSDFSNPTASAYTISAANSTETGTTGLNTLITLVNDIKLKYNTHVVDSFAHKAADTITSTAANATDQTTADTLLNDLKSKYSTHIASATIHDNADSTNTETNANGTNLATAQTLANDLKTQFNAHIQSGIKAPSINLIGP